MKSPRVLVLESTEGSTRPLVDLMREKGYDVQVGQPGPASVRKACEFLPEFLVLEVEPEIRTALRASPVLPPGDPIDRRATDRRLAVETPLHSTANLQPI